MPSTPRHGFPYPAGTDAPDVPADMGALATALDAVALDDQGLLAGRPAAGNDGSYYYATDTGIVYRDNGTTWVAVGPVADSGISTAKIADGAVTPAKHSASPYCQLRLTDVFINSGVTATLGDGGTGSSWNEEYDTDSMHDPSTNPSRITFQRAGLYLVTFVASWDNNATGTTGQIKHTLTLGGGALGEGSIQLVENLNPTGGIFHLPKMQTFVRVTAAGAWVTANALQTTGASRSLSSFTSAGTRLCAAWIGGV